ncbi:MAG: thioredoxin family protein, partial [Alistipes sp.]|nr:thioredoxin family protein [Alistipes sp.]
FSCTGPLVGSVLIKSTSGEFWSPIITMAAFATAFALPFTLLAWFPSLLKNLPKSGGWLNSVKVVLGFIEVALGFKFLSVADQTYHWHLLDREVYLAIWIAVFSLLGLYLLGKIRFAHDSKMEYLSVKRLALAIAVFSFVIYLIPGMFGAPLKALSGYMPPMQSQDFVLGSEKSQNTTVKYGDELHLPLGLTGYFDLQEGLAEAKRTGKPLFVDITGHGCVNCREMEQRVWSDPRVLEILRRDYVIVALYVDDKMQLDEADYLTTADGKVLKQLGRKNSYIVQSRFGVNAQPAYVLLSPDDELLAPVRGYDLDVDGFVEFLKSGL